MALEGLALELLEVGIVCGLVREQVLVLIALDVLHVCLLVAAVRAFRNFFPIARLARVAVFVILAPFSQQRLIVDV